jgi:hypothetical protein
LQAIKNMSGDDLLTTNIGDWSSTIKNFDPFDDELSFKRIQEAILK